MRVRWTSPATEDLYRIVRRIQQDNPSAALRVGERLYDGCSGLANFPSLGRTGRIAGTRELVISGLPYIIVYRIQGTFVEIVRIYHRAQDWP